MCGFSTHIRSSDCAFGWLREIWNAPPSDDVSAGLLVRRVGNVVAYSNRTYARTVGRSRQPEVLEHGEGKPR